MWSGRGDSVTSSPCSGGATTRVLFEGTTPYRSYDTPSQDGGRGRVGAEAGALGGRTQGGARLLRNLVGYAKSPILQGAGNRHSYKQ